MRRKLKSFLNYSILKICFTFVTFSFFGASNEKVEEWQYVQECTSYLTLGTWFILCNLRWFGSYCGLYILKMLIILGILAWLR